MIIGHQKQWDFLKNKFETDQLSHAYLFSGQDQIGKKLVATKFAEYIGCKFPDLMIIVSDQGKEIPISKVREAQNFLGYKSYNGGYKIVIVDEADKMNSEAQNCFLKTLEEPKGRTILFLISSKPDLLLSTIFSRCQLVKFFKPKDLPENKEKLEKEQNLLKDLLPILTSNLSEKFKYVKSIDFDKQNASEIVEVLQKYLRQQFLSRVSQNEKVGDLKRKLEITEDINNKLLFTNANSKLALEILLMEF
jgi:DNA polymerase-3 subunit delta'